MNHVASASLVDPGLQKKCKTENQNSRWANNREGGQPCVVLNTWTIDSIESNSMRNFAKPFSGIVQGNDNLASSPGRGFEILSLEKLISSNYWIQLKLRIWSSMIELCSPLPTSSGWKTSHCEQLAQKLLWLRWAKSGDTWWRSSWRLKEIERCLGKLFEPNTDRRPSSVFKFSSKSLVKKQCNTVSFSEQTA